jgi:hypothetical protein
MDCICRRICGLLFIKITTAQHYNSLVYIDLTVDFNGVEVIKICITD